MEKGRIHIIISGRVQGVFFRDFTRQQAKSLGLRGWVRNLANGDVEVIAEGEKDKLEALIRVVKIGPPYAQVDNCQIEWSEFQNEFSDFRIVY